VIPNNPTRKHIQPFDALAYKRRNIIERTFCRLKDWRRVATRYDKLAINFAATCYIAAICIWWAGLSLDPRMGNYTFGCFCLILFL
jgi:putative transposase